MCDVAEDKRLMEDHKQEVDTLQRKVSELQVEYKLELKKTKDLSEVRNVYDDNHNNNFHDAVMFVDQSVLVESN